jgi:hypothetical protein
MARPDDKNVPAAFAPHLHPGETLKYFGYGVKQPPIILIMLFMLLAILPGIIATAILTKHYLIGLTDKRFLVLRINSMGNHSVKEVLEYSLPLQASMVAASTGPLFTHINIKDPAKPFVAKFHRMGMKTNREHTMAIASTLTGKALAA